jgi:hypothetical protein
MGMGMGMVRRKGKVKVRAKVRGLDWAQVKGRVQGARLGSCKAHVQLPVRPQRMLLWRWLQAA